MPRQITFSKFDLGVDLRKGPAVSDANRLQSLINGYVTTGLAIAKRPGLTKVATLEPGTKGLFAANGVLNTFYCQESTITHSNGLFRANRLENGNHPVAEVHYATMFNGYIYCVVSHEDDGIRHHYLDRAQTMVTDGNCPQSAASIKMASKIFAVGNNGDVVRYSATGNPRDWTTAEDAGFLPTGMNAQGEREANALGIYKKSLVVMSADSAQIWAVDPDPTGMGLEDAVANVGSSFPRTVVNVNGDLYFLSDYGFRSITTLAYTQNLSDVDIGSPIDTLVREDFRTLKTTPRSFYFYGTGQYVTCIGTKLYVYSVSASAKVKAWSVYYLPEEVDDVAQLGQDMYLRCGDNVYRLDQDASTDDGEVFETYIQIPYMDFKKPGVLKHVMGVDLVCEGSCYFSIGYNEAEPEAATPEVVIRGNTRPGGLIPLECLGTEFNFRIRNRDGKPFRLDAITVHYESLGPV